MSKQARHLYEFGPFRLDTVERTLLCHERPVPLTPKAFDTLLVLVENTGHVLGKDELMEKVWPDSFVEENNLAQNISVLRRVLGEGADGLKYIETVPKRGYRFVADVRELVDEQVDVIVREHTTARVIIEEEEEGDDLERIEPATDEKSLVRDAQYRVLDAVEPVPVARTPPALLEPHTPPRTKGLIKRLRRSKKTVALALALVFVVVAISAYFALFRHSRQAHAQPRALAILPFRNLKQDAETDFLGFSLADAIISKLGYVSALTVRPSSYVDKYRNQVIDPKKVADELNVNTLLTGNFIKEGDDLRITAQLVDVNSQEILWQEAMDLKYEKLLTVQDRVAQQIIKGLEVKLSPDEAKRLKMDVPQNPLAYEYYLRGVDRYSTNEFPVAIEMLEKSVALDPNFALAWAHLGTAYAAAASFQFGGRELYSKALAAYEKALLLNPEQIEARIFTANTFTDTNRVEQAVPLLREALKANQNYALAHWELGYAYRFAGMLEESIAEGERAREIDPEVKLNSSAFNSYFYLGQYAKFLQSLPSGNDAAFIIFYRGFGYYYLKDWQRAAAEFDRAYEAEPSLLQAQIGKALSYAIANQKQKGIALLRETERKALERGVSDAEALYKIAQAYAVLGDKPSALGVLRHSIEGGFFCYPYFINDALMDNLRGETEYATLMEMARRRHEDFKRQFF